MEGTRTKTALLAVTLGLLLLPAAQAQAATITVAAGVAGNAADGQCSLREAVQAANTNVPVDNCTQGQSSTTDVINVPAGTYTLSGAPNEDNNASGDLDIEDSVQIIGAGAATTTIDANSVDRVIDIDQFLSVLISGVTITGGALPAGPAANISDGQMGGGIRAFGLLTLDGAIVTNNFAGPGGDGGIGGTVAGGGGGNGGGIYSIAPLTIVNSTISGNRAGEGGDGSFPATAGAAAGGSGGGGGRGGGIYCTSGGCLAVSISGSTISGNFAGAGGPGGFANSPGNGGSGGEGGGVMANNVLLENSTVTDNRAGAGAAGGGDADGNNTTNSGVGGRGGGLVLLGQNATITNSAITLNRSGAGGPAASGFPFSTANTGLAGHGGDAGGVLITIDNLASITGAAISGNQTGNGANSARGIAGWGGRGGGLVLSAPVQQFSATLRGSTINGNLTGNGGNSREFPGQGGAAGGGLIQGGASAVNATIENTTVTANTTGNGGTSTFLQTGGMGGEAAGLHVGPMASATLTHLTIAGNLTGNGGNGTVGPGVRPDGGGLFITSNGGASSALIGNTILASNLPGNCTAASAPTVTDQGGNLIFGAQCPTLLNGLTADPLLAALADNGGPTQTMALPEGSPATDVIASSGAGCLATDQRGTSRPQGSACDIGAFERTVPVPDTGGGGGDGGGGDGGGGGGTTTTTTPTTQTTQPGTTAATDRTAPVIALRLLRQRLLRALSKGYRARFTSNELGRAVVELFASGRDARGAQTGRKRVGRGTRAITKTGTQIVVVRFTKRAKKAFAKRKKVTLTVRIAVSDAAGNRSVKSAKIVLKR